MKSKPLVIAHRGYSGKYPENTFAAFQAAIDFGADMIELDVHLTKDGALLVTHDFELGRNCATRGTLFDFTSKELRRIDAGSWFAPGFNGERFPVLGEVLGMAKGKVQLNVEIKEETLQSESAYNAMAEKILMLLSQHGMLNQVVVSSFDWKVLQLLRGSNGNVRLGLLNHEPTSGLHWDLAKTIGAYSYHPNFAQLTEEHVREMHTHGLKVFAYTANTEAEFRRLNALGVDGIITNEVEALKKWLG